MTDKLKRRTVDDTACRILVYSKIGLDHYCLAYGSSFVSNPVVPLSVQQEVERLIQSLKDQTAKRAEEQLPFLCSFDLVLCWINNLFICDFSEGKIERLDELLLFLC